MTESAAGYVLGPGDGRAIDLGAFSMNVKASEEQTGGLFSLLEATEPPGFGPPLHIHHGIAEAFYVLDGEYLVVIGDEEHRCSAGSFILVPAGTLHGFRVGGVPSRKLNLYLPAAMVGYFDEMSEAMTAGDGTDERLSEIAGRYAMEVIGPVPDGYL